MVGSSSELANIHEKHRLKTTSAEKEAFESMTFVIKLKLRERGHGEILTIFMNDCH